MYLFVVYIISERIDTCPLISKTN